jgi:hypothetical protein
MIPAEQEVCARWLEIGSRIGLVLLVASFAVYCFGLLAPLVPPADLARLWGLPVGRYVAATGAPTGWGWLHALGKGDSLNLLGVAVFATVTAVAYARIVPDLARRGMRLAAALAALQVVVLLIAASGLLA